MPDLVNIFDAFLPQLLRYPNPNDPLNGEAATLLLRDAEKYNERVRGALKEGDVREDRRCVGFQGGRLAAMVLLEEFFRPICGGMGGFTGRSKGW